MKKFLKYMLLGIRTILISFVAVVFTTVGILELTNISSYSGFKAVYIFFMAIFFIAMGLTINFILGYSEGSL